MVRPRSSIWWARRRFAALIGPRLSASVVRSVPSSISAAASSQDLVLALHVRGLEQRAREHEFPVDRHALLHQRSQLDGAAHAHDQAELALRPHDRCEAREIRRRIREAEDVVRLGEYRPRASARRDRRCDRRRRRHRAPAPSAQIRAATPLRSRAGRRASSRAGSRSSRRRPPRRSAARVLPRSAPEREMPSRSNSPSHAVSVVSGNAAAAAKPSLRGLWPTMRSSTT